jgi:hypothetical protein
VSFNYALRRHLLPQSAEMSHVIGEYEAFQNMEADRKQIVHLL